MIKTWDLALVVGRFQPLHYGHQHTIDIARSLAGRVIVLCGSADEYGTKRNPFPVNLRAKLIREVYPDEQEVIVGGLNDLTEHPGICPEWGLHILQTCKQYTRKVPELIVFGKEEANQNWFSCSDELKRCVKGITEVAISREKYDVSGTTMREYLFRDEFDKWASNCNPHLHKYYDELRTHLLNSKGLEDKVRIHLHPSEGWTDKPIYLSQ